MYSFPIIRKKFVMKKGLKITLIVLGAIAGVVSLDIGVSLIVNAATRVETSHELNGKTFNKIDINIGTADVYLKKYSGTAPYVKCIETSYAKHEVAVEDNTLKIDCNVKERYTFLMISPQRKIELYVPTTTEYKFNIHRTTGDVFIDSDFNFSEFIAKGSTGDISTSTNVVSGKLDIDQSTGDVKLFNVKASSINIETSTGNTNLDMVKCIGELKIKSSTGEHYLNYCDADKINIETSTGDVDLKSCDANSINIKTSTGDVTADFRSSKIVYAESSTGKKDVPKSTSGGLCSIETSTGDIKVTFSK